MANNKWGNVNSPGDDRFLDLDAIDEANAESIVLDDQPIPKPTVFQQKRKRRVSFSSTHVIMQESSSHDGIECKSFCKKDSDKSCTKEGSVKRFVRKLFKK
jgi:hypothetical protein